MLPELRETQVSPSPVGYSVVQQFSKSPGRPANWKESELRAGPPPCWALEKGLESRGLTSLEPANAAPAAAEPDVSLSTTPSDSPTASRARCDGLSRRSLVTRPLSVQGFYVLVGGDGHYTEQNRRRGP